MTVLRSRALAPLVAHVVALVIALASGCARTVQVKVEGPHTDVTVGDVALGTVPDEGAPVEVPAGIAAVPFEVRRGDVVVTGELPRTEPSYWVLGGALGGAACCVPTALALGFCVANPGALLAPYLVATGIGDFGAVNAACVSPSWATLPLLSGCTALGLTPALLALWADAPPAEVTLVAPADGGAPADQTAGSPAPTTEGVPW